MRSDWQSGAWDQQFVDAGDVLRARLQGARETKNLPASLIAHSPLLPTLLLVVAVLGFGQLTYILIAFGVAVGAVISVVLAREDRRILNARGLGKIGLPSPYIALIAPWLYLCLRGNRLFQSDPRALIPFWQNVGLGILFWVTVTIFPTLVGTGQMLLNLQ